MKNLNLIWLNEQGYKINKLIISKNNSSIVANLLEFKLVIYKLYLDDWNIKN